MATAFKDSAMPDQYVAPLDFGFVAKEQIRRNAEANLSAAMQSGLLTRMGIAKPGPMLPFTSDMVGMRLPVAQPIKSATPTSSSKSDNTTYYIAGGVALLAIVGYFLMKRA